MLEIVSREHLITRPRYMGEATHSTGSWWQRDESVALATLCNTGAPLANSSIGLGRSIKSIAWRASDTGLKLPSEWRDAIYTYKTKAREPRVLLQYPYIKSVRGEHELVLAVNRLVPKGLPEELRADVCQEILLQIYMGDVSIDELASDPKLVRKFITKMRRDNYESSGYAISLDAPMRDGRSWYDVLPEPETDEPIRSFAELALAFPSISRSAGGNWERQKHTDERARKRVAQYDELGLGIMGPVIMDEDIDYMERGR